MKRMQVNRQVYERRIAAVQNQLKLEGIDLLVTYSSEGESASSRYLTGFWPFFDFVGIAIPAVGKASLITGGPESYEFAREFSHLEQMYINPLYVESSAPEWVPDVSGQGFEELLPRICPSPPKVIALADWNITPHTIFEQLKKAAKGALLIPGDELMFKVRAVKDDEDIPAVRKAYEITEQALLEARSACRPGVREYELETSARIRMLELGAEGMPYPSWVCSGEHTRLSLCRSTDRKIKPGDLVQFTIGSKYQGYCGNMCRPIVLGSVPEKVDRMMDACIEATEFVLETMRPGLKACDLFDGYYSILERYGFQEYTLYGPAHGTGFSEVEGLWLSKSNTFTIVPNMVFNVDIWLTDGTYGMRYEEGVLVTVDGIEQLNPAARYDRSL